MGTATIVIEMTIKAITRRNNSVEIADAAKPKANNPMKVTTRNHQIRVSHL